MENCVLGKIIGFITVLILILIGALFGLNYLFKQAEHAAPAIPVEVSAEQLVEIEE